MFKRLRLVILLISIVISLNSCVLAAVLIGTAAVAGGAVYYINGNYIIEVSNNLRSVYNATIKTIQMNSKFSLKTQSYNNTSAQIKAYDYQTGDDISINLSNLDGRSTEIKIRVGVLGDEKRSATLANDITKNIT